jgi:hypothetical protein
MTDKLPTWGLRAQHYLAGSVMWTFLSICRSDLSAPISPFRGKTLSFYFENLRSEIVGRFDEREVGDWKVLDDIVVRSNVFDGFAQTW